MRSEIRSIISPDVADLTNYYPEDPEDFSLLVQLSIGPGGMLGEETFSIEVTTPLSLLRQQASNYPRVLRHILLVRHWDHKTVIELLQKVFGNVPGADWTEIAHKLSRFGMWEFEDYKSPH